ncbi:MAG: hypothetical protein GQ570_13465 [Helicobacteraceae bacterium]|nr:hypothetical protein [Helicobacteraceae bacterium]
MSDIQAQEIKSLLLEQRAMLSMLIPDKASISYLAETTNKSRQAIREYILNHYEPQVDFWKEKGKMFVSKEVAIAILRRSNNG